MIRDEGLLCGGSCGSAMAGAIQAIKHLKLGKGKRVVVLLADSTRNYMTKFLKDEWMQEYDFEPKPDEKQYKPLAVLKKLAEDSPQLQELSCEDTWVQQSKKEPKIASE